MRGKIQAALAAAAIVLCASSARAVIVWGVDVLGATNGGTVGDRIIRFDSTNVPSAVQVVGDTGIGGGVHMSGLDFTPNGNLYSIGQVSGSAANLYTIDKTTGAATVVGSTGTAAAIQMTDLAYDPAATAMLALSVQGAGPTVRVYSINVNTGNANLLGAVSGLPSGSSDLGLSCDSTGKLYIEDVSTDQMFTLSGMTATAMSSTIGVDCAGSQGMTMDWSDSDQWYLGRFGPSTSPFVSDVRRMNLSTGATSLVLGTWPTDGTTGLPEYELSDLAIRPTIAPEPTSLGVFAVAGLAGLARRRRQL